MILQPTKENINFIVSKLLEGQVVIFPTDTVFGIGCLAIDDKAIQKIYKLKNREKNKSLLLNVANITTLKKYVKLNKLSESLIKKFMPGELSVILNVKGKTNLSPYVIKNDKVGIRIPNNKVLLEILTKVKIPLVSTSCNISGKSPCISAVEAEKIFGKNILILDTNMKISGKSSTIIDITGSNVNYIREGGISFSQIQKYLLSLQIFP